MGLFDEISQNITKKVTFLTWAGINFGVAVGCSITTITAAAMKKKDQCHDFRQLNSRAQCRISLKLFSF